jgi:hypothetical protein
MTTESATTGLTTEPATTCHLLLCAVPKCNACTTVNYAFYALLSSLFYRSERRRAARKVGVGVPLTALLVVGND